MYRVMDETFGQAELGPSSVLARGVKGEGNVASRSFEQQEHRTGCLHNDYHYYQSVIYPISRFH